jgi:hypothetical protein
MMKKQHGMNSLIVISDYQSLILCCGLQDFMEFFIYGSISSEKSYILEIVTSIKIGGIVEVFKNTGKHGIYLYISGLYDICTIHFYKWECQECLLTFLCSLFRL